MKAVWITKHGGPDVLALREAPDPAPLAGDVRIRVRAAGLNFAEVLARKGLYPDAPRTPCVVGYEGAGVVDAVGPGVTDFEPGMRVLYLSRFGGHADTLCVPARQVHRIPDAMSFEEAAALPVNYLTAYHMLFRVTRIDAGDHVLVHMAAGGVGTAMLQLARTVPGVVTYGTCSANKHEYARKHGLDHAIDYHTQDYVAEIRRLTQDRGVDYVYDALGGHDWKRGMSLLRPGGMLVAFGIANANRGQKRALLRAAAELAHFPLLTPYGLMNDNKGFAGVNIGHMWGELELLSSYMDALIALYERGKLKPHVDSTVPFSKARDAYAKLELGKNEGKVLLIPD